MLALLVALVSSRVLAQARTVIATHRGGDAIAIDGVLDEAAWSQATPTGRFVEREPHPGAAPPVATNVRVLFDGDALYLGLVMSLAEGEVPRGLERTRDSSALFEDDAISIKIDPRLDHRTTLGFCVNAAGAQTDYIAIDNGRSVRFEHDASWESAVVVGARQWVLEVRIPAAALGLSEVEGERAVGLQVSRDHNARAATYDWSPMAPEFGPYSALHYGVVRGLRLGGGTPLTLLPYAVGSYHSLDEDGTQHALDGRLGGEAQLRLAEDTWAQLTVLPDFAQVDLDDAIVNLNRFPLFYPERRPFFLSGLDVFEFGMAGLSQPFFSRRIGLDADGHRTNVLGGVKVYGREGPIGFGALDVLTEHDGILENDVASRARVSLDGAASYVGALLASRQSTRIDGSGDDPQDHLVAGVDGLVRTLDERLELSGFAAGTTRAGTAEDGTGEGVSSGAAAQWRGEVFQPTFSALYVGDQFAPDVGFVRRRDATRLRLDLPFIARPRGIGIRRAELAPAAQLETSADLHTTLFRKASIDVQVDGDSGWFIGGAGDYIEDTVLERFEPYPGVTVDPGTYEGAQLELWASTPEARNPVLFVEYDVSNAFFGGTQHTVFGALDARLGAALRVLVEPTIVHVRPRDVAPFTTYAINGLLRFTPLTTLQIDLVARASGEDRTATGMLRVRWRYAPGSDVYLVYQEDASYADQLASERTITLKLAHRLDLLL